MDSVYVKKYNELLKKHELLNKKYRELESIEQEIEKNTTLDDKKRLQGLNRLAAEYEKISILMQEVAKEAEELKKTLEE